MRPVPSDDAIGPVHRLGRYTLFKKIAVGGMAEIWMARQGAQLDRFVVIKKILTHLADDPELRELFLHEARTTAQLTHPNIAQVYELDEVDGTYFIAMELVLGENLSSIVARAAKRQSPLPAVLAARIIADAAKGLDYAHRARRPDGRPLGIVHRDVSPQNVLVTFEGDVKVIDFGIAKATTQTQKSPAGEVKGKFSYMSPEQCMAEPVDRRGDVFSLGVVLYELYTGQRLFKHDSELVIMDMIVRRPVTPPSQLDARVPAELDAIVMRALEKEPTQRFQSALELHTALEAFIRAQEEAAGNTELGAYVSGLFGDRIDQRRRLLRQAARELPDEDDVTPVSRGPRVRRRTVYGRAPVPAPRLDDFAVRFDVPRHPAATPVVPAPFPAATPVAAPFTGVGADQLRAPDYTTWFVRSVVVIALLVAMVAGAYLYVELRDRPLAASNLGRLAVTSEPAGAELAINGTPLLWKGQRVSTPVPQLGGLVFGTTYTLTLTKPGYQPYTLTVILDAANDGQAINATLLPQAGAVR